MSLIAHYHALIEQIPATDAETRRQKFMAFYFEVLRIAKGMTILTLVCGEKSRSVADEIRFYSEYSKPVYIISLSELIDFKATLKEYKEAS